jgi:hypothetical protein
MCSGDLKLRRAFSKKVRQKRLFKKSLPKIKGFLEKNPPLLNTLEVAYEITKNLKI